MPDEKIVVRREDCARKLRSDSIASQTESAPHRAGSWWRLRAAEILRQEAADIRAALLLSRF